MSLVTPTEGASEDTWDTLLNAAFDLVDAHDHSSGKGVRVPIAGINVNADLAMGGFAVSGARALDFTAVATSAVSSYAGALFMNSADNELYWRTSGGSNVQLTSGTSLNSSLLGGFEGDYATATNVACSYSDSTKIYNFLQQTNHRGKIDCADVRIFEPTAAISNAVKLLSPTSLAASYDWIFPAALPASTSVLTITSAGQVASTRDPSVTTITTSGNATIGGTTTSTGLITATAGVTAAANQHVTVSGTGRFKHGTMSMVIGIADFTTEGSVSRGTGSVLMSNTSARLFAPIRLPVGARILDISVNCLGASATAKTFNLYRSSSSTPTAIVTAATNTNTTWQTLSLWTAVNHTLTASETVFLHFAPGTALDEIAFFLVTYDYP